MVEFKSFFCVLAVCITVLIMYFTSFYPKRESVKMETQNEKEKIAINIYNSCMDMMMNKAKRCEERFAMESSHSISFETAKDDCRKLSSIVHNK